MQAKNWLLQLSMSLRALAVLMMLQTQLAMRLVTPLATRLGMQLAIQFVKLTETQPSSLYANSGNQPETAPWKLPDAHLSEMPWMRFVMQLRSWVAPLQSLAEEKQLSKMSLKTSPLKQLLVPQLTLVVLPDSRDQPHWWQPPLQPAIQVQEGLHPRAQPHEPAILPCASC